MILLQAQNVARYFGSDRLFSNISMTVSDRDRIGLVGRNGSGKSTLLKILVGEESSDEGQVSVAKNISLGYLSQRTGIISDRTVWDEMLTVFDRAQAIGKEMELVEEDLANPAVLNDPDRYQDRLNKYDSLQAQFKEARGYSYKSEIKTVLAGFRFYEEDYDSRITELSGGQKTRLALAKLLLTRPDLLVLDEPTNHLDMDTLTWLEDYLQGYQGAILIVSHDRYFLDLLVKDIYDLSFGQLTHYPGNYSNYLMEKEKRVEKQWKDYEKQQKEIKRLEDFVQKNITRASTSKRAQSRQKQLDNMIRIDRPQTHQKSAKIIFQPDQESGDLVLQVHDLTIGYDGEATAKNINLEERKGDIIAIVGSNGVGKTTLLKSLVGDLPLLEGDVQIGTKVDIGYYDQEQQHLHQNKTILNELWDDHPNLDENVIRTLLGSFLFSGDDVLKSIYSLSGGEKARVALAKLALQKDNFLILDEPTNHLDIDSKEVLEDALDSFAGTILFVSHDRYFINRIANKVVELEENGTTLYLGNYDYYLQKKEELKEIQALNAGDQDSNNRIEASKEKESETALDREELKDFQRQQRRLSRDLEAVEEELNQLEEERQSHHNQLLQPEIYNDLQRSQELADRLDLVKQEIEDKSQQWEDLALALEELEQK